LGFDAVAAIRFLLVVLVISTVAIFLAYPPLLEGSDGECSALEQRVADLASRDGSGLLTVTPLYGSTSSQPSGATFVKDRYPLLPTALGCTVAFWRTVFSRPLVAPAAASLPSPPPAAEPDPFLEPRRASAGLGSIIARDITPNGDPISPATVFTLPMDSLAIRVDYPANRAVPARFQVVQGKAILASCSAERSTPGIAWCKFTVSLRKGNYSILLTANKALLGQYAFTVIGR
jgi:hypothetical protein